MPCTRFLLCLLALGAFSPALAQECAMISDGRGGMVASESCKQNIISNGNGSVRIVQQKTDPNADPQKCSMVSDGKGGITTKCDTIKVTAAMQKAANAQPDCRMVSDGRGGLVATEGCQSHTVANGNGAVRVTHQQPNPSADPRDCTLRSDGKGGITTDCTTYKRDREEKEKAAQAAKAAAAAGATQGTTPTIYPSPAGTALAVTPAETPKPGTTPAATPGAARAAVPLRSDTGLRSDKSLLKPATPQPTASQPPTQR